jgi:hypothetical protein
MITIDLHVYPILLIGIPFGKRIMKKLCSLFFKG